jgi:oligoribonuclease NrnB/cAMP/cGMP phosphodiesterase (DHH superfamily)
MTDAEKLQKLVEMARDHDYWFEAFEITFRPDSRRIFTRENYQDEDGIFGALDREFSYEEVLFDHDFIKSLCRAKYGEDWDEDYTSIEECVYSWDFDPGRLTAKPWHHHLCQLAVSTDRIGYLWEQFGAMLSSAPAPE